MSDFNARSIPVERADMSVDTGLRSFMTGVFNKMALGLAVSAGLAYTAATVEPIRNLVFGTPLYFVFAFGPLVLLLVSGFFMKNPSPAATGIIYWGVVSMLGISLGTLVLQYGGIQDGYFTIMKAFLITAGTFGALALWGSTTKRDLSGFGVFLFMGLIGLVIASLVNLFFPSPALNFAISVIGVLVFAGLTAFDTQRLKHTYYALGGDQRGMAVATNYGALSLYLDFINLFLFILRLLSPRN